MCGKTSFGPVRASELMDRNKKEENIYVIIDVIELKNSKKLKTNGLTFLKLKFIFNFQGFSTVWRFAPL